MKPTIVDQSADSPYLRRMMLATWLLGICLILPFWWFVGFLEFTSILAFISDGLLFSFIKTMILLSFVLALIAKGWWLIAKCSNHADFLFYGNFYRNIQWPKQLLRNRLRVELYCFLVSIAIVGTSLLYLSVSRWEWRFFDHRGAARMRLSENNLASTAAIIEKYKLMGKSYPKSLEELTNEHSLSDSILMDGWHNRLIYEPSEDKQHYLLIATNSDGFCTTNWENTNASVQAFISDDDYSCDLFIRDGHMTEHYLPQLRD